MSLNEYIKKRIEDRLEIPYSEFEKLDLSEQHRLIEEKMGIVLRDDYQISIDNIPHYGKHIITEEQADRKLDKILSRGTIKYGKGNSKY